MRELTLLLAATMVIGLLALFTGATAASPPKPREGAPRVLILDGVINEGGAQGHFEKIIDLDTGFSRLTDVNGPMTTMTGFDGRPWTSANGAVSVIDLPGLLRRARALAFVDRAGWRSGGNAKAAQGSSAIQIRVRGGRADEITVDEDEGSVTIDFDDWRRIGGLTYPFRQTQREATGEVTVLQVEAASLVSAPPPGAFAPPPPDPHGRLLEQAPTEVPFELVHNHIIVKAEVNGRDSRLVFDTGGANYLGPAAAQRLGLTVSGGVNVGGVGEGSIEAGFAPTDDITLGRAQLRHSVVAVGPLPWPTTAPDAPDGLTGHEFLSEVRTTLDYEARTLRFTAFGAPYPKESRKLRTLSDDIGIYVYATLNGHRGIYGVDTGDGGSVTVFKTFAEAHGLMQLPGETVKGGGIGGGYTAKKVRAREFDIAGFKVQDFPVNISLTTTGAFASKTRAGNLGAGVLRCFRLTFDYHDRVLALERQAGTDTCLAKLHPQAPAQTPNTLHTPKYAIRLPLRGRSSVNDGDAPGAGPR